MLEMTKSRPETRQASLNFRIFEEHYTHGSITSSHFSTLDRKTQDLLTSKAAQFTDVIDFDPKNFAGVYTISHTDGTKTYAATHTKTLQTNSETDRCIYVVDATKDGAYVGYGEVVTNLSPDKGVPYYNEPFVGYTYTVDEALRQGLGKRRLMVMNALSQMINHLPLHSSDLMTPLAEGVWEKLVEDGIARAYQSRDVTRYVFNE